MVVLDRNSSTMNEDGTFKIDPSFTTSSASTFSLDGSACTSTTTWYVVNHDNGDFTIVNDPLEEMRLEFEALSEQFFEEHMDELKEPDPGHVPFGRSRTSRIGRELSLLDKL